MTDQKNKTNNFYIFKKIISHYYIFLPILIVFVSISVFIESYNAKIDKKKYSTSIEITPILIKEYFNNLYPELGVDINNFNLDYSYVVSQINENKNLSDSIFTELTVNQNIFLEYFRSEVLLFNKKYINDQLIRLENTSDKPSLNIKIKDSDKATSLHDTSIELVFTSKSYQNNINHIIIFLDEIIPVTIFKIYKRHVDILTRLNNGTQKVAAYYIFHDKIKYENLKKIIDKNYEILSNYQNYDIIINKFYNIDFFSQYIIKEKANDLSTLNLSQYIIFSIILSIIFYVFSIYIFYTLKEFT